MHTVGSVWPVGSKSGAQAETPPHYESQTQQMPKSIHTQACHFSVMEYLCWLLSMTRTGPVGEQASYILGVSEE